MPTQPFSRASPSEGFSIARQVMDDAVEFYLANGGPAVARINIDQLASTLKFYDGCKEAYCDAIAKINMAEEAERQRAYAQEQQKLINQLMGVIQTSGKVGKRSAEKVATDEEGHMPLPAELSTPRALQMWRRLQQAGYIDENYQPAGLSRTEMAILAFEMSKRLGISNKWKTFETLWGKNNLRTDYNNSLDQKKSLDFRDDIKRLLTESVAPTVGDS